MDEKQKNALEKLVPDEVVNLIETRGETETKRLEDEKVEFKEKKEKVEPAVEKEVEKPKSEETEGAKEEVKEFLTLDDVKPAMEGFAEALKTVIGRLDAMDASLKTLAETDEERINKKVELTPKESLKAIAESVIGKKETEVDGRTKLAKDGPEEIAPLSSGRTGIPLVDNLKARNIEKSGKQSS